MKKFLISYGGMILFYISIVLCIIMVNARFSYLNKSFNNQIVYAYSK